MLYFMWRLIFPIWPENLFLLYIFKMSNPFILVPRYNMKRGIFFIVPIVLPTQALSSMSNSHLYSPAFQQQKEVGVERYAPTKFTQEIRQLGSMWYWHHLCHLHPFIHMEQTYTPPSASSNELWVAPLCCQKNIRLNWSSRCARRRGSDISFLPDKFTWLRLFLLLIDIKSN